MTYKKEAECISVEKVVAHGIASAKVKLDLGGSFSICVIEIYNDASPWIVGHKYTVYIEDVGGAGI